ncbi:Myb-like DNA-binding domain protein [Apophysomyces sp. BC1021]|nr:Myb-like DNA-binding domain protein [Apophysomyces sp. BC1021]
MLNSAGHQALLAKKSEVARIMEEKDEYSRNRRIWTPGEDDRLLKLADEYGSRWSTISKFFDERCPSTIQNRYKMLRGDMFLGPWSKEELGMLRDMVKNPETTDWEAVQLRLPRKRPISILKLTWKHSLDPKINHGRWSKEEADMLKKMVELYGPTDNWASIAAGLGTRTPRQCLERWRWQENAGYKGRFTEEEDRAILMAVSKYGDNNFAVIKRVIGSPRTPRHLSQHYHYGLSPNTDRSPWTDEERELVYQTCLDCDRQMKKAKDILNSKRSCKDLWNQFYRVQRQKLAAMAQDSKKDSEKENENENEKSVE